MEQMKIQILNREHTGSGGAKRTRKEGFVPGVIYGKENSGQPVKLDVSSLRRLISKMGSNAIFNADYRDKIRLTLLKEVQTEPVSGDLLHVDLLEIDADQTITTHVSLAATGADKLSSGGVLQQLLNEVEINCLPMNVPKVIEFDVSGMAPGQSVHVSDLKVDDNVEIVNDPDESVAAVTEIRVLAEDETDGEEDVVEEAETAEGTGAAEE